MLRKFGTYYYKKIHLVVCTVMYVNDALTYTPRCTVLLILTVLATPSYPLYPFSLPFSHQFLLPWVPSVHPPSSAFTPPPFEFVYWTLTASSFLLPLSSSFSFNHWTQDYSPLSPSFPCSSPHRWFKLSGNAEKNKVFYQLIKCQRSKLEVQNWTYDNSSASKKYTHATQIQQYLYCTRRLNNGSGE